MKKCKFCAEEIQNDAIKCKHCGEFLTTKEKNDQKNSKKKWLRAFSLSVVVIFIILLLLFSREGSLESHTVQTLAASITVAIIGGGMIAYFKSDFRRGKEEDRIAKEKKLENENTPAKRKKGVIMLIIGSLLILLNINRGGGFTSSNSVEATGYNMTSLAIWIASIVLVVKGIKKIRRKMR